MYDVSTEVIKDVIPFGIDITPLDREIAKYYVTDQGRLDALNRGILYPARGRALEKQRKKGTLNQYQVDNLENMENFMDDTLLNKVFSAEFQGFKGRMKPKTPEDIRERLKLIFMGETQLGERHRFGKLKGKLKDSPGGAVGLLQVEPSTFQDVVREGQFGPKAAKASGLTPADLDIIKKTPDNKVLTRYLENPEVNYMAATAKIFQYLKEHNL